MAMRSEITYQEKNKKKHKHKETKEYVTNSQWITVEIREETKKTCLETNGKESTMIQNLWEQSKAVIREKLAAMQSLRETRKI